jgi:hypothetical protein
MKTAIASLLVAGTLGAAGCATRVILAGPPPARVEVIGVAPFYGAVWVPGHWVSRYSGWVWVRGHWR